MIIFKAIILIIRNNKITYFAIHKSSCNNDRDKKIRQPLLYANNEIEYV